MFKYLFGSLFFIVSHVHAQEEFQAFKILYQGFKTSERSEVLKIEQKREAQDFLYQAERYPWNLTFDLNNERNDLASLFSFQAQLTSTQTGAVSLSKRTFSWGEFEFNHTQRIIDVSEWVQRGFLPSDSELFYEVRNSFNYRYDFWDKSLKHEKELIDLSHIRNTKKLDVDREKLAWDFYQAYIRAKNDWFKLQLTQEIVASSQKRFERIRKRVNDGLSRGVELYQSENALNQQKENLVTLENNFQDSLNALEAAINQQVDKGLFNKLKNEKFSYSQFLNLKTRELNPSLNQIDLQVLSNKILEIDQKRLDAAQGVKFQFNAGVISNAFQDTNGRAMDGSLDLNENVNKVIGLRLIIPLGGDRSNTSMERAKYLSLKNEIDLKNLKSDLSIRLKNLSDEIERIDRTYDLIKMRISNSQKILKDQTNFYEKGIASFDDVLRAEESLIADQINEKNLVSLYDLAFGELSYLHDELQSFLNDFQG